jgi:hypothetical protein
MIRHLLLSALVLSPVLSTTARAAEPAAATPPARVRTIQVGAGATAGQVAASVVASSGPPTPPGWRPPSRPSRSTWETRSVPGSCWSP